MNDKRQKIQLELAFPVQREREALNSDGQGTESLTAQRQAESPAITERLMEEVCERENCWQAWRKVKANKGAAGVDGKTIRQFPKYLKQHWPAIREQLLSGTYKPQPVRRVQIPKPDGGMRNLGIPTVLDRLIQQAVLQVLQRRWDATFSEHSYGFRPNRSAHQAIARAQEHVANGCRWVVDLDLEKFFDRVNHHRLLQALRDRISDPRMLRLIAGYLHCGVMENGLVSPMKEGTPQGGPLSPLLSNLVLDELDRELERRGHRFVRYADDCNIYVQSEAAGRRVMASISRFITRRLKLKVNQTKSAVARPQMRKFLGFSFVREWQVKRRIAPQALLRFKQRVREMTRRNRGVNEKQMKALFSYLRGWLSYFCFCETPSVLAGLAEWVRRRLRAAYWKQWKRPSTRYHELRRRGVEKVLAARTASSAHGAWRVASSPALHVAFPHSFFTTLGFPPFPLRRLA